MQVTSTLSTTDAELMIVMGFAERIGNSIRSMWGFPECESYLSNLILDTRNGTRQGFPPAVATAIMVLHSRHQAQFNRTLNLDKWASETRRTKDLSW